MQSARRWAENRLGLGHDAQGTTHNRWQIRSTQHPLPRVSIGQLLYCLLRTSSRPLRCHWVRIHTRGCRWLDRFIVASCDLGNGSRSGHKQTAGARLNQKDIVPGIPVKSTDHNVGYSTHFSASFFSLFQQGKCHAAMPVLAIFFPTAAICESHGETKFTMSSPSLFLPVAPRCLVWL